MSFYSRQSSYWDQYDFIDENPICTKRALPQNNSEDNECKLKEILNETWFKALASTIKANYDSKEFLGPEKYRSQNIIPRRSVIFRCLDIDNNLYPSQWRVIIIADYPSSKHGNACSGLPFYDNMLINHWMANHSNNSIKYFYFNLLQYYGIINDEMDDKYENILPSPYKWISYLMSMGVMFLNQTLTTGGNKEKDQHQRYWKPIVRSIIFTILNAKKNLKKRNGKKGTLFVVFDKKTKNFIRAIHSQIKANKKTQIKIIKMDYNFSIHFEKYAQEIKLFQKINSGLEAMSMDRIEWLNDNIRHQLNKIKNKKQSKVDEALDFIKNAKKKNSVKQNVKSNNNKNTNNKNDEQKYDDDVESDEFSC